MVGQPEGWLIMPTDLGVVMLVIERGVARYNWHTGKWEWGEPPKER